MEQKEYSDVTVKLTQSAVDALVEVKLYERETYSETILRLSKQDKMRPLRDILKEVKGDVS